VSFVHLTMRFVSLGFIYSTLLRCPRQCRPNQYNVQSYRPNAVAQYRNTESISHSWHTGCGQKSKLLLFSVQRACCQTKYRRVSF